MGVEVDGGGAGTYRAEPEGEPIGAMVLIHEIWGLVPHIRSIADRWAAEGWLVLAPDILSGIGVPPEVGEELFELTQHGTEEERQAAQPRLREVMSAAFSPDYAARAVPALRRVVDLLADEPGIGGRIAVVGFCFGGTYAYELAAADDRVAAAVPFYGSPPAPERIPGISCPVLGIYGGADERLMASLPDLEEAMGAAGKDFAVQIYRGAAHAFFNGTGPRYDVEAAEDAWATANAFLARAMSDRA